MAKTLLISQRADVMERWRAKYPDATAIPHEEALARTFADAHANGYRFDAIVADFRDANRSLIRALYQTASFNQEQVAGTALHMDVDPGSFAEQQKKFFSGLGMACEIIL